jgi:hypothetical protein
MLNKRATTIALKKRKILIKCSSGFLLFTLHTNGTTNTSISCIEIFGLNNTRHSFEENDLEMKISRRLTEMTHIIFEYERTIWNIALGSIIYTLRRACINVKIVPEW